MLDAIFQAWQINVIVWGALVIAQWVIHTRYISVIWNKEGYHSASVWRTTTDPKHVRTIEWAAAGFLSLVKWPAQSLNLISFGLLWDQHECMLCNKCPTNQSNLLKLLQEALHEISPGSVNELKARLWMLQMDNYMTIIGLPMNLFTPATNALSQFTYISRLN